MDAVCRFQYPRADRLIVGGGWRPSPARSIPCFSILVRIDLLLGRRSAPARSPRHLFQYPRADRLIVGANQTAFIPKMQLRFQYPRADRLIVGAEVFGWLCLICGMFQYPRADRLIVGGDLLSGNMDSIECFSILVRIDLLLGQPLGIFSAEVFGVSVSSCGSTYCWG